jgi:proline racemase
MHAKGEIRTGETFVHESIIGTKFTGVVTGETRVGTTPAVNVRIAGRGWITAFHNYVLDPSDPFPEGFRLGDQWPDSA